MSDDSIKAALEAMELKKARLLKQAQAEIDRVIADEMAELEVVRRYLERNNLRLSSASEPAPDAPSPPTVRTETAPVAAPDAKTSHVRMTMGTLAELYRTDARSPYRELRAAVRSNYDGMIDRIVTQIGTVWLDEMTADGIDRLYQGWSSDGTKLHLGHAMVTKLRLLFSFGTVTLDDPACQRLSTIMSRMRFATPTGRSETLSKEQVNKIREKAHERKRPSVALAQAFQFELMLRQKDVIGEWVPVLEDWPSDIVRNDVKWVHGLRWEEIDEALILRHTTSFHQKEVIIDLKLAPMVMQELGKEISRLGERPKKGPVILSEWNNLPWSSAEFRRIWRKVADDAGIPRNIKNMDSSRTVDGKTNYTDKASDAINQAEQERSVH